MDEEQSRVVECCIGAKHNGKFPPDVEKVSGLGFDRVFVGKNSLLIRKNQGNCGKAQLFVEIEMQKNRIKLRYGTSAGSEETLRKMHAVAYLHKVLCLFPKEYDVDASEICRLALPALQASIENIDADREMLLKKYDDMKAEFAEISSKNKKLLHSAEIGALSSIELERQNCALGERIRKLEGVGQDALCEMILEWIGTHRGSFNSVAFCKANGIASGRAEEGMQLLLRNGALQKVGSAHGIRKNDVRGLFEIRKGIGEIFQRLK
jgi:hypothetical protein